MCIVYKKYRGLSRKRGDLENGSGFAEQIEKSILGKRVLCNNRQSGKDAIKKYIAEICFGENRTKSCLYIFKENRFPIFRCMKRMCVIGSPGEG